MASRSPRYDLKIPEQELQAIVDKAVDLAADVGMESKLPHESSRRAEASSAEGVHGDSQKASETTALGSVPSDATKTATKHATNQTGGSKLFTDMSEHRRMELQHKIDNQKHHKMKHEQQSRKNMFSFVHSDWFGMVSAVTILLNSAYIGIQGNAQVQWELKKVTGQVIGEGDWFAGDPLIGDLAFCIIFTVELILRVAADRNAFLFGLGMRWNLFDSFVVAASLVEVTLDLAGVKMDLGISVLRALRVVRIIRLLRVSANVAILCNLKTMLYSLAGSGTSFLAALILLASVMYIFALLFIQGVVGYLRNSDNVSQTQIDNIGEYYGALDTTLWTLLGAVTGGYDWSDVAEPLVNLGPLYTFFFLLYISFVLFGLLNILNGIFVNAALESSEMNRELQVNRMLSQRDHMVEDMVNIFLEADKDNSGTVTMKEFEDYLEDERVKAYFMALELDLTTIRKIFALLDEENKGELGIVMFVEGCIRFRGAAKMVDIQMMQKEYEGMLMKFESQLNMFETQVMGMPGKPSV